LVAPDGLVIESRTYAGTILGGLGTAEAESEVALAWDVDVALVERMPLQGTEALAPHWKLIAQPGAAEPVRGISLLATGARFATAEAAGALWDELEQGHQGGFQRLSRSDGTLLAGATSLLRWNAVEVVPDPENFLREVTPRGPVEKSLAVGLQFDGHEVQLGLGLQDLAELPGDEAEAAGGRKVLRLEWALPDVELRLDGGLEVFFLPSPFDGVPAQAVAIRIQLSDQLSAEAIQAARAELEALPKVSAAIESESEIQAKPLRQAVLALQAETATDAAAKRGPLLFLAESGGGPLTRDLVLTAEDDVISAWTALLPVGSETEDAVPEQVHWWIERAAWVCLARLAVKDQLPMALEALLLRHGGEVGRYPSTIEDAALQSADRETMRKRLLLENRLFLEDSSPSARVRAFDWLVRQGEDLGAFDPLANQAARRDALRVLEDALEATQSAAQSTGPEPKAGAEKGAER